MIEHLQRQNVQDGWFHLAVWLVSLAGLALLFRAMRARREGWNGNMLVGAMLAGWGMFNFVEGLVNHHLLSIHHVLPGHRLERVCDLLFLATGPLFVSFGWYLSRTARAVAVVDTPR